MTERVPVRRQQVRPAPGDDYIFQFELAGDFTPVDAHRWAERVFAEAPLPWRLVLAAGWRYGLGLNLSKGSGVAGWTVVSETPETVVLAAESRLLGATNTVEQHGGSLIWTTTVSYRTRLGRLLWSAAAPVHHLTLPLLLRRAARAGA